MSTLRVNTLANQGGTQSTAIENAINGSARAWVNFNGTGTVAIRKSFNVSSITDNGVGNYNINFATAMPDADYNFTFGTSNAQTASINQVSLRSGTTPTVDSIGIIAEHQGGTDTNLAYICASFHG
jgi:hypothetical protein